MSVVEKLSQFDKLDFASRPKIPKPQRILMVSPEHFRIEYAINPLMRNEDGSLKQVDEKKATQQWLNLKKSFEQLAFEVVVLDGQQGLPDMVFSANQAFPFFNLQTEKRSVVLSQMAHPERQSEVECFEKWFKENDYDVYLSDYNELNFEGNGDALVHPTGQFIWGGYGSRTDKEFYKYLNEVTALPVVALKLKRKEFYHLDTCFSLIDFQTVVIEPSSFSPESLRIIYSVFKNIVEVERGENLRHLVCNCVCVDGSTVIVNKGSGSFKSALTKLGYRVVEIDLSEFAKAGGAAFCLKMMIY